MEYGAEMVGRVKGRELGWSGPSLRASAGRAGHARVRGYEWDGVNAEMIAAYLEVVERHGTR